ncbi:MAG: YebC/PmpR family DNA-binding transcriptional regulator [Candidatus Altimarinota bacterium]
MARHSKWANIKHRKSAVDAKRGKIFTRLSKLITVAAQQGGGDIEMNASLRAAVQKAKEANLPADNIERAIKKGTGELKDGQRMQEISYEGYGPGGVAMIIRCLTDNTNRSYANVRNIMTKNDSSLGVSGCVSWMFQQRGVIESNATVPHQEAFELLLIDAGAEDIIWEEGGIRVLTSVESFERCLKVFDNLPVQKSELSLLPQEEKMIDDVQTAEKISKMIEQLEEEEDVDEVFTNASFSDEVLKTFEGV